MSDKYNETPILEVKHVTKEFSASRGRKLLANDDISLKLYQGQTLGIVGESGCGKSTLIRMIAQLEKPTKGEIYYRGTDITKLKGEALRKNRRHIQMVFQDPGDAFSPKIKIKNIVCEPLLNFGMIRKSEVDRTAQKLLEMVELPGEFAERYPHSMSGGQRQRVGIARSMSIEPDILICDEATSALDVSVQKKIIELLLRLQKEKQITMIFICHDISLVRQMSHRVAVMYLGSIVELVDGRALCHGKMHPYTEALGGAVFSIDMDFSKEIESIESEAPSPLNVPVGCPFQNRCAYCKELCTRVKPGLKEIEPGHWIACHLFP